MTAAQTRRGLLGGAAAVLAAAGTATVATGAPALASVSPAAGSDTELLEACRAFWRADAAVEAACDVKTPSGVEIHHPDVLAQERGVMLADHARDATLETVGELAPATMAGIAAKAAVLLRAIDMVDMFSDNGDCVPERALYGFLEQVAGVAA